jgi:hypothetical protein
MSVERIYDRRRLADPDLLLARGAICVDVLSRADRRLAARTPYPGLIGRGRRGALPVVCALVFWPEAAVSTAATQPAQAPGAPGADPCPAP